MTDLSKYFELSAEQIKKFEQLPALYEDWNSKINVVSRKDIDQLLERHVLHSLAITKIIEFSSGNKVIDIGTGGGFPGIPLAIYFPEVQFTLCDSIAKKIKVVEEVQTALQLKNVHPIVARAENVNDHFDFVLSRAVAPMNEIFSWTKKLISNQRKDQANGWIFLKGGDLDQEIQDFKKANPSYKIELVKISDFFEEEFFETKKLIYCYR